MSGVAYSAIGTAQETMAGKPDARSAWRETLPLLLLALAVFLLFRTAPYRADMWWSDAPRHAMDGAFYRDVLRDLPIGHLRQYAMDYYLQYPALTILFYPPLFPLVEALFFAIFGVSAFSAQLTVTVFYLAAAWGAYFLCRRWLARTPALAVSLLFVGAPEVAFWGRQVMLEIPAVAVLIWTCVIFLRYLDHPKPGLFYLTAVFLAAGAYTKQTDLFIVPVFLVLLWLRKGWTILSDRHIWIGVALFLVLTAPLIWLSLTFGRLNAGSVAGGQWNQIPVFSLKGWLFYLREFPGQVTWPVFILAGVSLVASIVYRSWWGEAEKFFAGWLIWGYIFFSLIALKEPRHTVLILLPLAFFAVQGLWRVLPARVSQAMVFLLAGLIFGNTLLRKEVPHLRGFGEAAAYVAAQAPPNGVILFSGYRDGAFIFDMRTREDRRVLSELRSDKLLLRVPQRRELGLQELDFSEAQTAEMLNRYGVSYVVNQANFWDDLKNMQQLQRVLHSKQFRLVATIPVQANIGHADKQLEIYENLGPLNPKHERIRLDLPIVGVAVEGNVGKRQEAK